MKSICGTDCTECGLNRECKGCRETDGRPFGETCMVAAYCQKGEAALRELKEKLIEELNGLDIPDMEDVTDLNPLKGSVINISYGLPGMQSAKFWNDNSIYLGNQLCKKGSDRCYGIAADDKYLMVSEYGANGSDAQIVVFKRWNRIAGLCPDSH